MKITFAICEKLPNAERLNFPRYKLKPSKTQKFCAFDMGTEHPSDKIAVTN